MSWLNGIPVIGHGKAFLHFAVGDRHQAGEAFLAATRSTAVVAGGAAGLVTGGPAGAIAGAMGAGALTDCATSVLTNEPQGLVQCVGDIAVDISNGEIPIATTVKTGLILGLDAVSGLTAGGAADIAKSVTQSVAESTGKSVLKTIVITETSEATKCMLTCGVRNEVQNFRTGEGSRRFVRRSRGRSSGASSTSTSSSSQPNSNSQSNTTQSNTTRSNNTQTNNSSSGCATSNSSGAGGQPPRQNQTNNNNSHTTGGVSHWVAFMDLFNVTTLDDITINGVHVFRGLKDGQKKSLKKLIANLRRCGYLKRVVKTLINLFKKLDKRDVTFQNFLSMAQIVVTYIGEQVARRNDTQRLAARAGDNDLNVEYTRRREEITEAVADNHHLTTNILELLMSLVSQVSQYSCEPDFRTIYAAVAHYLKHRVLSEQGEVLSVQQYYELILSLLPRVTRLVAYLELTDAGHARRELVFDRYFTIYGRRVRIVIKVQDGSLELSSCYVLEISYEDDEQSDEFLDGDKLPKPSDADN